MGASGWHYFVPFDADVNRALQQLREDVFRSGKYHSPSKKRPASIEALVRMCAEDGTHSILDVTRVVSTPLPPSLNEWLDEFRNGGRHPSAEELSAYTLACVEVFGAVGPVPQDWIVERFSSARPQRSDFEDEGMYEFFELCPRGTGVWTAVYDDAGAPSELLFVGKTGD
jgi:hypothetical protein